MTCTHTRTTGGWVPKEDLYGEPAGEEYVTTTVSTTEDIDTGRYRCTQCGKVMYYTGLWREFYENGTPCPGSERVRR